MAILMKNDHYDPLSISKAAEEFCRNVIAAQEKMLEEEIEANVIVLNGKKFSFLNKPGWTPTLFGMKVEYANLPESIDFFLQHRIEPKYPQTNADRIRAMTDEELAKYFSIYCWSDDWCKHQRKCEECWLEWLREEAADKGGEA